MNYINIKIKNIDKNQKIYNKFDRQKFEIKNSLIGATKLKIKFEIFKRFKNQTQIVFNKKTIFFLSIFEELLATYYLFDII